ncbi:MAG: malto-oligosyltrehalose synthase [Betaproteobacteria bacterium]|nr:malto-oligosyltrehalose synthase [Betaproteobacteria bacterium]
MSDTPALERLAALCGIEADYHDIWGKRHLTSDRTRRMLLAAMGIAPDADPARLAEDIENRDWRRLLPPVRVVRLTDAPLAIEISVPAGWARETFNWTLNLEQGARHGGQFRPDELDAAGQRTIGGATFHRYHLPLPAIGEIGYHHLELERPGQDAAQPAQMTLVVAPADCYRPAALRNGGRAWGPAVQLYGVRSRRNWGIGDFGDVAAMIDLAAESGAGIVGLNPLHALYPDNPAHCSPYSPSSRLFLNVLYIDVEAVVDVAESKSARDLLAAPRFQARLRRLRAAELVEYAAVGAAKLDALRLAWRHFREHHLAHNSERALAFRQYCADQGEPLRLHALFEALQAHFRRQDAAIWGWPAWPEAYHDPAAAEVAAFASSNAAEVDFHRYLQWLAEQQLAAAGSRSWSRGLGVGLYQDLALGVDPGGAEAWANRDVYAVGAHAGAPPDDFNMFGQDWGLPPFNPWRLRERAYAPFAATLRASMRHCGALRIDHVMGLMRLYWVPVGATPAEGAYVAYPLDDLLGILALESQRNRCMVIGEDLGTVPDALRPRLAELGVLSYRPFFFERNGDGAFKPPQDYPRQALVAVSTHDLPTLCGFWKGLDLDTRAELGLFPTEAMKEGSVAGRAQDRARLLMALQREKLLPEGVGIHPVSVPEIGADLSVAVHRFLARTPAQVMAVQQEDVFGVVEQPNLPGSNEGHPNWRRRLPVALEDWREHPRQRALAEAMRQERGSAVTPHLPQATPERKAQIPRATYRLQFNRDFTLAQATQLVPYLAELGISHCYASPYLKARPGSGHGYDIVDHNTLNPEIGSAEDFERFVAALRAHGMGQLLDMVPNHMGVMGADNNWWLDVLENGQASAYASYFDIDWEPLNAELRGKVLLPLLGDHYGTVLNRGELTLGFDAAHGEFSLAYYQHRLPVDPAEYPRIVAHRLERLVAALGAQHETLQRLQSLVTAFGHLPPRTETDPARCAERNRDKEMLKRQLAELCAASADVAHHLEENVAEFNGRPGDAGSFELMHELIKAQTWRLAYWQVASDEINYRRFFDINDLAALRMENDAVFEDTHRLVLDLIAQDKVHGLRIDHPDGLYDPGRYFRRLQSRVCGRPEAGPDAMDAIDAMDAAAEPAGLPLYLVLEKIMAEHEWLPADWPIHGATGYRFANLANNLFVDATSEKKMTRIYADFIGERIDFDELVYQSKKLIMHSALASELNVLANRLARIASASRYTCDFTLNNLRGALMEVVACFPVYRSYLADGRISVDDQRHIEWAVAVARKRSPAADVSIFDFVKAVLTTQIAEGKNQAYRDRVWAFAMKFQQFTSPVMAKGLEDTSFYCYNRLTSLNDVGGDPRRFGVSVAAFHAATRLRAERWPHNMLATSTHDSKRAEDVRARISVLSEIPAAWKLSLKRWSRMNRSKKRSLDGTLAPSANDEYLLYQTLIGTWPLDAPDEAALDDYRARIEQYMVKAVREAKAHSSWINVNVDYEAALAAFVQALLAPGEKNLFLADFAPAATRLARFGLINGLSQALLKLTSPGVPDLYQGCELWQFNLVDPDNRRPVDYAQRARMLAELKALADAPREAWPQRLQPLVARPEDGRIKLYLTWRALRLRARWADLFRDGDYLPLAVDGTAAEHLCAFARCHDGRAVVVVVPRLLARLYGNLDPAAPAPWGNTRIALPREPAASAWHNALTGQTHAAGESLAAADLLGAFPVALLASDAEALAS